MQKERRLRGGKNTWRGYTNEEIIKQRNIEMEGTYTRKGHTREGTCIRRGSARRDT